MSKMFGNKQGLAEELRQGEGSTSQKANSVLAVMVGASVELGQGKPSSDFASTPETEDHFPPL